MHMTEDRQHTKNITHLIRGNVHLLFMDIPMLFLFRVRAIFSRPCNGMHFILNHIKHKIKSAFQERFLIERIKLDGKTGQLEGKVNVERLKQKLVVTSEVAFSKRYLKYLTKKFLKKNKLRDWLRVIANNKDSYELRYFNIDQDEEMEGDE